MKVDKMVPEIYYKESRDFSYVGRLFEILFNYVKTNVDLVGISPINNETPSSIIDLMAMSLGFESKHDYQIKDLVALCSTFALLLRNKGNVNSIEDAMTVLLHTQRIDEVSDVEVDGDDAYKYIIYVPVELTDIVLLEDLFEYILPSGWLYSFRKKSSNNKTYNETFAESDDIKTYKMKDYQLGQVGGEFDTTDTTKYYNTIESEYGDDANRSMTYTGTVAGGTVASNDDSKDN